jgi:hypothetical protein
MRVQYVPQKAKLPLQNPKNLILVENTADGVIIRAARDNLSERDKACLIRYLAAEGFISDEFECFGKSGSCRATSITWLVEQNRASHQRRQLERAECFMIQLLISASALWLALFAFALLRSAR